MCWLVFRYVRSRNTAYLVQHKVLSVQRRGAVHIGPASRYSAYRSSVAVQCISVQRRGTVHIGPTSRYSAYRSNVAVQCISVQSRGAVHIGPTSRFSAFRSNVAVQCISVQHRGSVHIGPYPIRKTRGFNFGLTFFLIKLVLCLICCSWECCVDFR